MEDNKCERVMNRISICFLAFLKKLLRAPLELTKEDTPFFYEFPLVVLHIISMISFHLWYILEGRV